MQLLILYLGMAASGYFTGARFIDKNKEHKWISKVTLVTLMVLIFTMGARMGSDDRVISTLQIIGLKALVITIFTFVGSILACIIVRKLMKIDRKGMKIHD